MDGSCNGLQNFSAMLRDEVGGQATNLTNNAVMEDIYSRVADAATKRMAALPHDPEGIIERWLTLGIDRSAVKRSVMTTPYGVTKRSAVKYVIEDYLRKGKAPCFDSKEYYAAAAVLMDSVWPAIGDVVVKSREAMDWLSLSAKRVVKAVGEEREGVIAWFTPSGFLATQAYYELEEHRINTRLHGTTKIKVVSESDEASSHRHASGLAPNFVHSMDAAHLHLTTAEADSRGIDALAMIHDDYGTHAANAELLYRIIREQFVRMYEDNDPIKEFAEAYPMCTPPPSKGTLNLREVLDSQYFFS
jgi:DNA-directed RNA polymerase